MRMFACFAAIGALAGTVVPLPAFTFLMVAVLIVYALVGGPSIIGAGALYDVILAAVALQIGYFLAVVARILLSRRRADGNVNDPHADKDT
jgi:uncharacterized membrane protein